MLTYGFGRYAGGKMLRTLRAFLIWAATPVFLGLALISYLAVQADPLGGMCFAPSDLPLMIGALAVPSEVVRGASSMWLMYLLMGLAHMGPWLGGRRESCDCEES